MASDLQYGWGLFLLNQDEEGGVMLKGHQPDFDSVEAAKADGLTFMDAMIRDGCSRPESLELVVYDDCGEPRTSSRARRLTSFN